MRAALTQGPIGRTLFRMSLPMVMGIVAIMVFNFVDAYYIGLLGTQHLAAISYTFPATFAIMSLNLGLGTANTTLVAASLGADEEYRARQIASYSIILAVMIVFCVCLLGFLSIDPFFQLMGADESTRVLIRQYMEIWYFGVVLLVIPMVGNSTLRATGDTRTPSLVMSMSALINGILDPFLIFGIGPFPRLEMQGAAISSVISWLVAMVVVLRILGQKRKMLLLQRPKFDALIMCWKKLLLIATPIVASNLLNPIALGLITAMVSRFGEAAVAATGVGARMEPILIIAAMGLASCMPPFVGQNLGAAKYERIKRAIKIGFRFVLLWQTALAVLLYWAAPWIAKAFSRAEESDEIIRLYLSVLPISYGFLAWVLVGGAVFNGLHSPAKGLGLNAVRLFLLYIPFAYIGSELNGVSGLYLGCTVANILAGAIAWFWLARVSRQLSSGNSVYHRA